MAKILVIGSLGQVGGELTEELRKVEGEMNVVASDVREPENVDPLFEKLDVLDLEGLKRIIEKHNVEVVYNLAALLSATAEKNMEFAWRLNMEGLFNVLNLAKEGMIKQIFWPSSIAVFGPNTPRDLTPQHTITDPNTVYGISKLAGERWCEYYHNKFNVDVRSIRYPGLIGYKSKPGGGTTDYAVDIFYQAKQSESYTCFLKNTATLPMMYMPDATRATMEIMNADPVKLSIWSSYNIAGCSFSPEEIGEEIKKYIPNFKLDYDPDYRQKIAEGWPAVINDEVARTDWGWKANYLLKEMVVDMLDHIK